VASVFGLLFVLSLPLTAQAGFFDFVASLLRGSTAPEHISQGQNSQNIPLLQAALNLDPNPSKGGGDITIVQDQALLPDVGPAGTLADMQQSNSDQLSIYVVREGDSLSQIAQMFNVSVNTIIWSNDIKRGDLISPGQTLVILPVNGVRHTVKSGETLASIVKKYDGYMEEVLHYNGYSEDQTLAVGDVVVIPGGKIEAPTYTSATRVVRGGGPTYSGYYMRPVTGVRSQGLHGYNAVDIAAPVGTPVVASAAGQVMIARNSGWNGGYGRYIVIKHPNGTQTLYAHHSSVIVSSGQSVVQGQVIGYVGSTGRSTGPHLHFEVRGAANPF
jgi:LysM repeat protein